MPLDSGIWRYTEDDVASPTFSELLNRLGDSVRSRLATTGVDWVDVPISAGITVLSPVQVCRLAGVVHWRGEISGAWTTAATVVVAPGGVPSWARPQYTYRDTGSSLGSSGAVAAVGTVGTDGQVSIRALSSASGAVYLKNLTGYLGA